MAENSVPSRLGLWVLLCAGVGLAACAGDFVTDPARPRVVRNLGTPYGVSDASGEVMRADSGAFSIVTVDIPNNRNDPSTVHWVEPLPPNFGGLSNAPQPALVPETRPAPPPALAKDEIKIAGQQKADDFYSVSRDNAANADLWVTCPSGVGSVTLERNGETWPALLRVHFRYDADRPFQELETIGAVEILLPAPSAGATGGGGGEMRLKVSEQSADSAQIAIPGFSRAKRIQINWIDAHR
jgi:hypothetical protein